MFARIENGQVAEYPLTRRQVKQAFYPNVVGEAVFDAYVAEHGYVPVTTQARPETTDAQNATLSSTPTFYNGAWVLTWTVSPANAEEIAERFEAKKLEKRRAIDAQRDGRFEAGFTVPSGPLVGKVLQVRTVEDRTNWLTSQAAYSTAVAQGAGAVAGATFRTADNETLTVTYLEGLTALLAMAAWGASVMAHSWGLKDAVNAATTQAALDAINVEAGWP